MSKLTLDLFGKFRAIYDGAPLIRFGSNKVQALLIYLSVQEALNGNNQGLQHQREALMELLWPGLLPQSAQNNLRQTIYKSRQLIPLVDTKTGGPQEFIVSERQTVQLNPDALYDLDVATFSRLIKQSQTHTHATIQTCPDCQAYLQKAAAFYKGDFLSDFYLPDSNDFEEWAWNLRALFRRQILDALDTLTLMMLGQGQYNQARSYAQRQLDIDPLRENAYRQLMEILAISGQPGEALAQYERLRQHLQDEMGMSPMEQTTAVYNQIRAGKLGIAAASKTAIRGYDIQEVIGSGGFGIVHRARQPYVNRNVAVKIIAPDLANEAEFIRRFEIEAQLVARLEHPYIVPLYDFWREPDAAYLVMRYLRGGNLEQLLTKGPLPIEKAGRILDQVCAALQAAHQQSIIHRDIKPANILLDETGNAYLSDFGFAKELGSHRQLTEVGAILGTPDFISPEQLTNEPVSPVSDIYSLGIVLFQMLTGRLPFPDVSLNELIYKHLHEQLPSVYSLRPELSPAMDQVIWQATAKDPQARFPTTLALTNAFQDALHQQTVLGKPLVSPLAPGIEMTNPYKGLRPFQEVDSDDFFGREALVEKLLSRLVPTSNTALGNNEEILGGASRFLAVIGPSGSGKSSVVKAGLIPALRRGEIAGSENWFIVEMVPGSHPLEELEAALLQVAVNPPPSLLEPLLKDERGLIRTLKRVLPPADGDERPQLLLFIDQFEELFTLVEETDTRRHFIANLITALQDSRSQLRLVIALRADFYDRPLQHPALGELLRQRTEVVLPLTLAELEQTIIQPAAQIGVRLEEGLTPTLAGDVIDQPGALPLLQYTLTELFENRQDGLMNAAAYQAIGGVLGALGRRADQIFKGLEPAEQIVTRHLFLRLVTLGEGVEDTRRRVLHTELSQLVTPDIDEAGVLVEKVIGAFGRFRLLTFDHDPITHSPTVEVAHEALLREWEKLKGWLARSRDDIRMQRQLAQASSEWLNHEREAGFLLRGSRLDQFSGWATETPLALTGEERSYLDASLEARKQRLAKEEARLQRELFQAQKLAKEAEARRQAEANRVKTIRRAFVGLVILFILATFAAIFGFVQRDNALQQGRLALAQSAAALSVQVRQQNNDTELAALLAIEAAQMNQDEGHLDWLVDEALRPLLNGSTFFNNTLSGHNGAITSVAFSPNDQWLASGSDDGTVRVWELGQEGIEPLILTGQEGSVNAVAFSLDGQWLAIGSQDATVRLWDLADLGQAGQESLVLSEHEDSVTSVAFGEQWLASGSLDGTVRVWDLDELGQSDIESQVLTGHERGVYAVAFSSNGQWLASGGQDSTVQLWNVNDFRTTDLEPLVLTEHEDEVTSVIFNDKQLVTGSRDGTVRVWNLDDLEKSSLILEHNNDVLSLAFSPDGKRLVSGTANWVTRLWNLEQQGAEVVVLSGQEGAIQALDYSFDGTMLATGSIDGVIRVWDFGQVDPVFQVLRGHEGVLRAVAYNPNGQQIATGGVDGTVRIWDLGQVQAAPQVLPGHDDWVRIIASESTELAPQTLTGHNDWVRTLAFSPSGEQLASGSRDGTAMIWNIDNLGQAIGDPLVLSGFEETVWSVAYSPNGQWLAIGSGDGTLHVWDTADLGQADAEPLILMAHEDVVRAVSFSPDGNWLASGSWDNTIKVWNTADFEQDDLEPFILSGHEDRVLALAFSPDSIYLASGSRDNTVRVWELTDLDQNIEEASILSQHRRGVTSVAFSPDGQRLASSSEDSTIRVWDWKYPNAESLILAQLSSQIWSIAYSPDGRWLASGNGDSTLRLWLLLDHLVEFGCQKVWRNLTWAEWQQYFPGEPYRQTCTNLPIHPSVPAE